MMMTRTAYALALAVMAVFAVPPELGAQVTHTNQVGSGADPFVVRHGGNYYFLRTTGGDIKIRRSPTLQGIGSGTETTVFWFNHEIKGHIWAPELHYLNGKWYIYATGSLSSSQFIMRMFVLEGNSQDPMGSYTYRGLLEAHTGALDQSPLVRDSDGALFLVWSQWDDAGQSLYIGPMSNPLTLGHPRVRISTPDYAWERNGNVNEGPIILKRGGRTMIVYSGSGTWTPDYCLGMLSNTDGNYLTAASWTKASNPIFRRRDANNVYCVGHNGFTESPSGNQSWIVYHATNDPTGNQESKRNVRIQRFGWWSNHTPNLDVPVAAGTQQISPDEAPGAPERGLRVEFFNNQSLTGTPAVTGVTRTMDFDWGTGAPVLGVNNDNFSGRWTGSVYAPVTGTYTFQTTSDDGVRLWLRDELLIDRWVTQAPTSYTGTIHLEGGQFHPLRLEYFEGAGGAGLTLRWAPPGVATPVVIPAERLFSQVNGLRGDYFSGANFNTHVLTRLDPAVAFDWGLSLPDLGLPVDGFSVRWTGRVRAPATGTYTFHTRSDDGVRLWVAGTQLIDDWNARPVTENSGTIHLNAGVEYNLSLEYFDQATAAVCELLWTPPGGTKALVPSSALVPPGTSSYVDTAPTISDIADRTIAMGSNTGALAFTVGDAQTAAGSLTLSRASSNTTLVPLANIVFGGSGANRTVTVTPAASQFGSATITVTVSDGALTASDSFLLTVTSGATPVTYTFDDGLQGWTELTAANSNGGPRNFALSPASFPGDAQNGAGAIGQNIQGGTQDSSHPTLRLRSPEFSLNGSGNLTAWLKGGTGSGTLAGSAVSALTANSADPGFQGIALRNSTSGQYVLSTRKSSSGDVWQQVSFTASQLAALDQNATYTLDLIDAGHGGWGWVAMDTVSIPGTPHVANTAPTISNIEDQTIDEDGNTGAIAFTIGDVETAATALTLSGTSSNTGLVPNANIDFGGSGANRTVTVTPAANQSGTATITITVSDGTLTASDTFVLTVTAVNDTPTISNVEDQTIDEDGNTGAIAITIGDVETAATALTLSGTSSNTGLVPNANIDFGGSGANRTVTVTPAANQSGTAIITITVSDGTLTASDTFVLTVTAVNDTPTISNVEDQTIDEDGNTGAIAFTIGDVETAATALTLSGTSSNTGLVPNANIDFGGSGANRTVTVSPAAGQFGTATITITLSDGELSTDESFLLTVLSSATPITYNFDDGTLQGWTLVSTDSQGRQFFALVAPSLNSPNTAPQSGSHFIGLHNPAFTLTAPVYTQDGAHDTLLLRSPEFTLNGAGGLSAWLCGGGNGSPSLAGTAVSALPASSSTGGFRGIALRNSTTGQFVLSASKTANANSWEQVGFTAAQLAALPQADVYTLDFIDAAHGGWGWVNLDSVSIPGNLAALPDPFVTWAGGKGLSGAAAAFDADPDGDGIPNGLEFLLGGQPNPAMPGANSSHLLPTSTIDGGTFVFAYSRSHAAASLAPVVEFTTDLAGSWTAATAGGNASIEVIPGTVADTVHTRIPTGSASRFFARLRVTPAP
jgi:GH43 family beta-xylosidase